MKTKSIVTLLLGFAATQAIAFETANLVANPSFEEIYEDGMPADWKDISHPNYLATTGTTIEVTSENFLRVTKTTPQGVNLGAQRIQLKPDLKQVRVALKVRSSEMTPGDVEWKVPGLAYSWILSDQSERQIGPGKWLSLGSPTAEWTQLETFLNKPADVVGIKVTILGIGWSGQADFDDITVEPIP